MKFAKNFLSEVIVMHRIRQILQIWASGQNVALLGALLLLLGLVVVPAAWQDLVLLSGGTPPLDRLLYYNADTAMAHVAAYGTEGRQLYLFIQLTVNLIFPFIYTLFGLLFVNWLSNRSHKVAPLWLLGVLLLPFFLDLSESLGIVWMLVRFPDVGYLAALMTSLSAILKWLSSVLAGLACASHFLRIFILFYPF